MVKKKQLKKKYRLKTTISRSFDRLKLRTKNFLLRRPHRSFRRSRRRDYARPLKLPSYTVFTYEVLVKLYRHRKLFLILGVLYGTSIIILGGVTDQGTYSQINELITSSDGGLIADSWGKVGQAGLLLVSAFAGGSGALSTDQQVYLVLALIYVWLATVWLLRELAVRRKPRLRDGLYNSGAPFISTIALVLVMILQFLPIGIVALAYAGLSSAGVIESGFGAMLFYCTAGVIGSMVLYWTTSTVISLVIVTLPGMYPMKALRVAGDLVVGRRLRILYRLLWLGGTTLGAWFIVMIPVILVDAWAKDTWYQIKDVPFVPYVAALMSSFTTIWSCTYIYLLYRKIVDDDAQSA